ncbi:MAG: UPF0280 family protein [Synergistaceae bacterium]|nr:UPF0280 family protein [Synergistaceae bacterium]
MGNVIFLDHGPITMTLEAGREGKPFPAAAEEGAKAVVWAFDSLTKSRYFPESEKFVEYIDQEVLNECPDVLKRMIESVRALDEASFTPMAAVAGTFSDMAVEAMIEVGADFALANNGGDIACRIPPYKKYLRVGIISDLSKGNVTHAVTIPAHIGIGGIATSGFGGRSFTLGVASAVTAMSNTASKADAAATSIANACNCEDPGVERCLAYELDPMTDIAGLTVTRSLGKLRLESVESALMNGIRRTEYLCETGFIASAIIFLGDRMDMRWGGSECPFKLERA